MRLKELIRELLKIPSTLKKIRDEIKALEEIEILHKGPKKRNFVVLLDIANIDIGESRRFIEEKKERWSRLSGFIKEILEYGEISFVFAFFPEDYFRSFPILEFLQRFQAFPVVCPPQTSGVILKDVDRVDTIMNRMGQKFLNFAEVTDLIICTGDADFQPLAVDGWWGGKRVTVVSGKEALSTRFEKMAADGEIEARLL